MLEPSSGLMYIWETMEYTLLTQADSPHPLLLRLQWDACGFSLRRDKHFDVQREGGKGQRRERKREFNCLSCPSPHSNAPLFCHKQATEAMRAHLQGSSREACQRCRLELRQLVLVVRDTVSSFLFFFFFSPLKVLFLMTGTKRGGGDQEKSQSFEKEVQRAQYTSCWQH